MQHHLLFWPLVLASAVALVPLVTGLVRGRLEPAAGLVAIVLLPGLCFVLENAVLMERAKNASFCGSCHEMEPYLRAARSGGSGSLASLHFAAAFPRETGCYTCHSGYGVWGDLNAKVEGVSHMWASLWNGSPHPISLNAPVDVGACLGCHAGQPAFDAVPVHSALERRGALESGELGCSGLCHPPAHVIAARGASEGPE